MQATIRAWYNPNLETRWNMIPSLIGTLTMIQTLILMAMSVAREREQGTFDQLLVTPFRPAEIMAGKALPAMLIGIIQATMILLVAQFWFHIPFIGSFVTLYAGLGLFLLAAVGIGLLVSSIAATMQQAMLYSFLVIMPFVLVVGPDDADQQHARVAAILDAAQSAALRDRDCASSLPGRSGIGLALAAIMAAGTHRVGDAVGVVVAVSAWVGVNFIVTMPRKQ